MTTNELRAERKRIGHLHAFRAVTIIGIVAVHVHALLYFSNAKLASGDAAAFIVNEALLHNGTVFFAMISGLLFAQVLESRGWKRFFSSKARNVALPYLVVTILNVLFAPATFGGGYVDVPGASLREFPSAVVSDLLHFEIQRNPVLWYIPVLLILFALTPLVVAVLRSRWGRFAMIPILAAPLLVPRIWPPFGLENVAVYLAPYAAGLYFGMPGRYEATLDFVKRHRAAFIVVILAASAILPFAYAGDGEWERWGLFWPYDAATYVQKMAAAPLVLLWLKRFDEQVPSLLNRIADDSFAIYFLHFWACIGWLWLVDQVADPITSPWLFEAMVVVGTVAVVALLLPVIALLRKLLGKRSRMLIGA